MITTEIMTVTPQIAKEWLVLNRRNRPKKEDRIARWSRVMAAGKWKMTGESIKFAKNGDLIDGQNRLSACITADCAFTTMVIWGLEAEAQDAMDTNVSRSPADQLSFHNYSNASTLAAAIRVHYTYKRGMLKHCMSQLPSKEQLTNVEVVDYPAKHPEIVEAAEFAAHFRKALRIPAGAVATAFSELLKIDADDTAEFFSRIAGLRTNGAGDPIHTLIKRVDEIRTTRSAYFLPATGLFMIFRTWNACRTGEILQKFQFGSDIRGWAPMPEPK
jgi:hypothetical protein